MNKYDDVHRYPARKKNWLENNPNAVVLLVVGAAILVLYCIGGSFEGEIMHATVRALTVN